MSEQRTVFGLDGQPKQITEEDQKQTRAEAAKLRADKKARFVRILERGFTVDRLRVDLPAGMYGEWVPLDQVARWEALGFVVDTEYAPKRQLHGAGDASGRVGDTLFMTCSMEDHELYEEVRQELFIQQHGSPEEKRRLKQREEQEFENVVDTQVGLPVVDEGVERQARKEEIKDGIREAIKPSTPTIQTIRQGGGE